MDDFWEAVGVQNSEERRGEGRAIRGQRTLLPQPRYQSYYASALNFQICLLLWPRYILLRISVNPVPRWTRETNVPSFISVRIKLCRFATRPLEENCSVGSERIKMTLVREGNEKRPFSLSIRITNQNGDQDRCRSSKSSKIYFIFHRREIPFFERFVFRSRFSGRTEKIQPVISEKAILERWAVYYESSKIGNGKIRWKKRKKKKRKRSERIIVTIDIGDACIYHRERVEVSRVVEMSLDYTKRCLLDPCQRSRFSVASFAHRARRRPRRARRRPARGPCQRRTWQWDKRESCSIVLPSLSPEIEIS